MGGHLMELLRAQSRIEASLYLRVAACADCGQGPLEQVGRRDDGPLTHLVARCAHCGASRELAFAWPPPADIGSELINPADEPSAIIDAGQWLSLHYLLIESAGHTEDKTERRSLTSRAGQALDEALKFYADDELPPETAFFGESSRRAYAEHPEKFARQRLRDMRARLPETHPRDESAKDADTQRNKPWWRFW